MVAFLIISPQVLDLVFHVVPQTSALANASLLILRLFVGVAFIRHGWPKLRHLKTWATSMNFPEWLCFLSAGSMFGGGMALLLGLFTSIASLAIMASMIVAIALKIRAGFPMIPPDPYQIPEGHYGGPMGLGEPPNWEKAAMYAVMTLVLIACGGGMFALDSLFNAERIANIA